MWVLKLLLSNVSWKKEYPVFPSKWSVSLKPNYLFKPWSNIEVIILGLFFNWWASSYGRYCFLLVRSLADILKVICFKTFLEVWWSFISFSSFYPKIYTNIVFIQQKRCIKGLLMIPFVKKFNISLSLHNSNYLNNQSLLNRAFCTTSKNNLSF